MGANAGRIGRSSTFDEKFRELRHLYPHRSLRVEAKNDEMS